jgi:uncharacterized protein (DUF427 family)
MVFDRQWKGAAAYHSINVHGTEVHNRIWSYPKPTSGFAPIKDYLSFYASAGRVKGGGDWACYVDDERVVAQDG